ncbi:endo-1,4-beta-xylanase [Alkalicoccobacillus murimartini]|uniref:Beta-xylanase n=1 Tax=Alkalicoccobacillus murimartini TaxID=171685 RepID=A0ABT9YKT8_9BACI|nr:endo-1,4-beta-xylanase [Alkalicoccobacillus murimartini]MDQ0208488.1 endo-1,4-beta-xylanase [Alkalicoccobacillus murimartini]
MKKKLLILTGSILIFIVGVLGWMNIQDHKPIRTLAEERNLLFGTAMRYQPFANDTDYRALITNEFNAVTIENEMKMEMIMPEDGIYDFSQADEMVEFASKHDLKVRGHTLVWERVPWWLEQGSYTSEEIISLLKEYVQTTVKQYQGQIYAWDVVNEAFDEKGNFKENIWLQHIGPEYIELAFIWAKEADPNALLFYNDYENELPSAKTEATLEWLTKLREKGVPIDGIGMQMHLDVANDFQSSKVKEVMNQIEQAGFLVHITELDIKLQHSGEDLEIKQQKQADVYAEVMKLCMQSHACQSITVWGAADPYSWIGFTDEVGAEEAFPLLFDDQLERKPAYNEIKKMLREEDPN